MTISFSTERPALRKPPMEFRGGWQLPTSGAALPLVAADFENAARELGVETAAVHAVAQENAPLVGWTDLAVFVDDMFYSANQHLRAFLGFCRHNGLISALADHDWATFAMSYNGEDYRDNAYDTLLAKAYEQWR